MRKLSIIAAAFALVLGALLLPTLAQHSGRTITRETLSESSDFVRAGGHVLNRSHVAYVARTGSQATVYFVGNVPPLVLADGGEELAAKLAPGDGTDGPTMPNPGRSPFGNWEGRPSPNRVLPSPGAAEPEPELKPIAPMEPEPVTPAPAPAPEPARPSIQPNSEFRSSRR